MRCLAALLLTAAAVTAQSPLTTTFANNNGGALGGAVYFELECLDPAGVFITDIDLNFGNASTGGSIEVYLKDSSLSPHTSPDWVGPVATGVVAAPNPAGTPTNVGLSPSFQLGAGCKVGVAIVCDGGLQHAYTSASTLPSTFATAELELTVGGGSNVPFMGSLFFPRLVNINIPYGPGGQCPSIATVESQGTGCGGMAVYASFYEVMDAASFDLDGMKLTGTNNGSGYDITLAPGSGFAVPLGSTQIPLGDDAEEDTGLFGGTLGLYVGSNCWLATGAGNSTGFAPSVPAFLSNGETQVSSWTDLEPNAVGSGLVYYDEPGSGTIGRVTYNGVFGWGTTDPNSVQITYDTANGDFTIEWGGVSANNPENWLVGYSPGGPNADPGGTDISAAAPFSINDVDDVTLDLALTAVGRPVQGNSPVPFDVTIENIPPEAVLGVGIFGLTRPGTPLDGIGLTGCSLWASLDILDAFLFANPADPTWTYTAANLPATGPFRRVYNFNLQAAIIGYNGNNAFNYAGALTTNGLKCKTGKL